MPGANPHPNAHPTAGGYTNAPQIAADIIAVGPRTVVKTISKTRHHAMLLETAIKANASGRPGPRAPTGDYRRSWTTDILFAGDVFSAIVGTDKPQGPRLEWGFVGEDRIGRTFNQPPFPHMQPAADAAQGPWLADIEQAPSW